MHSKGNDVDSISTVNELIYLETLIIFIIANCSSTRFS